MCNDQKPLLATEAKQTRLNQHTFECYLFSCSSSYTPLLNWPLHIFATRCARVCVYVYSTKENCANVRAADQWISVSIFFFFILEFLDILYTIS